MVNESIVFSPEVDERQLDKEVDSIDKRLEDTGQISPEIDDSGLGLDGVDSGISGGDGGGMGVGKAGGAGLLAKKLPKPVSGVAFGSVLPVALGGAAAAGMLSAMHSSSARLQTSTSLLGVAWDHIWRPLGDDLDKLFVRPVAKDILNATENFEKYWTQGKWIKAIESIIDLDKWAYDIGVAVANNVDLDKLALNLGEDIWDWLNTKSKSVWDWITTESESVWDWITTKSKSVWDWTTAKSKGLWTDFISWGSKNLWGGIIDWSVKNLWASSPGLIEWSTKGVWSDFISWGVKSLWGGLISFSTKSIWDFIGGDGGGGGDSGKGVSGPITVEEWTAGTLDVRLVGGLGTVDTDITGWPSDSLDVVIDDSIAPMVKVRNWLVNRAIPVDTQARPGDGDSDPPFKPGDECTHAEDCPPGEVCRGGICVPKEAGGLQSGGVVSNQTTATVAEAGPEVVQPLSEFRRLMEGVAREAARSGGGKNVDMSRVEGKLDRLNRNVKALAQAFNQDIVVDGERFARLTSETRHNQGFDTDPLIG